MKKPVLKVNSMANFDFWLGMYRPRTRSWQVNHLRDLKKGFRAFGESDEEHEDKIKALEFLLGKR